MDGSFATVNIDLCDGEPEIDTDVGDDNVNANGVDDDDEPDGDDDDEVNVSFIMIHNDVTIVMTSLSDADP